MLPPLGEGPRFPHYYANSELAGRPLGDDEFTMGHVATRRWLVEAHLDGDVDGMVTASGMLNDLETELPVLATSAYEEEDPGDGLLRSVIRRAYEVERGEEFNVNAGLASLMDSVATMERETDDEVLPEGYMTLSDYAVAHELTGTERELLVRWAADAISQHDSGTEQESGQPPSPPIHRVVRNPNDHPSIYFDAARLNEIVQEPLDELRSYREQYE